MINTGLTANSGIRHSQQRGRHDPPPDAPESSGRRVANQVGRDSAAAGKNEIRPAYLLIEEKRVNLAKDGGRFRPLPYRDNHLLDISFELFQLRLDTFAVQSVHLSIVKDEKSLFPDESI
jgi:hypothetical protein